MSTTKVALVTGATAGIGRAVAFALGRAGYAIGVASRSADAVAETIAALTAEGIRAAGRATDVAEPPQVAALVAHLEAELGPVDTLINNAGVGILKPFSELSLEEWDTMFATNVRSMYVVTAAVLPGMRARKHGAIVNVASLAGRNAFVGGTGYAATKHAVLGFSKCLLLEVRGDGVRVVAICPGSVDTALRREGAGSLGGTAAKFLQPEDVADTILATLSLPERALVSELDIRPAAP
jgi:3-oxoacyl-[acyl-carrier protein] reductase